MQGHDQHRKEVKRLGDRERWIHLRVICIYNAILHILGVKTQKSQFGYKIAKLNLCNLTINAIA